MNSIIGNGAIAQQIQTKNHLLSQKNVYFASGVSNSSTTNLKDFEREVNLFKQYSQIHSTDKTLVYFSSLGIFDACRSSQPYFIHKKFMESLVQEFPYHCIVRLGELVGQSKNSSTLTNHFYSNLVAGKTTLLFVNALRALTDIESLVSFLVRKQEELGKLRVINLVPPFLYSPTKIYFKFAQITSIPPKYRLIYRDEFFAVPTDNVHRPEEVSSSFVTEDQYLEALLVKYYA